MDSEDVDEASPLPAISMETTETRTVATETSPVDTKEGARRPSASAKESLFARLKARLRPRPHPSATETDSSPVSPKKPRMSKAANQPKATNNAAGKSGQSGRADTAVTPPRPVEPLKSSTPMTTRGRSTAQLEKAPESTSKTPTAPQRSPLNGNPCSSTPQYCSPSTPPPTASRSSHKRSPPSPRSPTPRFATLRHTTAASTKTSPQPDTPDKEPPQDDPNSPSQPLQRIGNRLLKNQCGACGRVLSSTATLESHVSQHTGDRPFFCTLCGKGFPDAKGLNRHGRVHSGESHECPQCSKTFTYRFGLTKHLQMVHGHLRPFTCQVCSKGFFTQRDVEAHLRVHTGEKPFHCSLCEKKFKRKVELNVHLRWHNGEKRHWCPFCGKGFLDYNNLKRHKLIHTGEKPHRCPQCGKTFTQSGHLKKHLKNVHRLGEGHQG
ncbi:zinc finger protein 229-like [Hypomesus transpacificus]|uniref:zinc finger protein 229-like n=1 Tax=Hypomesus transpacificus TaxID=137520 RepID=UPI001F07C36A|nr:zinc finger protein 229-like [Hypomesus transpacificus]